MNAHRDPSSTVNRFLSSPRSVGRTIAATAAVIALGSLMGLIPSVLADDSPAKAASKPERVTLYSADPDHLWNRLHSALFVRKGPDGELYGRDDIDPWLWPETQFLLVGDHHQRVVKLLDEFLSDNGEHLVVDPLKQAVLQHDLWAVFDWLANPNAVYQQNPHWAERRALQRRLAGIIHKLAPSAEQISRFPDNLASAIAAKNSLEQYDPNQPDQPFLPPDLFRPDGPWVLLGEHMRSAAVAHVSFVSGRSAFFVFLNLPGGRQATLDYLEKLHAFPQPLLPHSIKDRGQVNPALPQFPAGTQVALAREMLVIDNQGRITPTRVIESIQFRYYRDVARLKKPARDDEVSSQQAFYEFRFRREDLFSGNKQGLHAVAPEATEYRLFIAQPHDVFESERTTSRPQAIMKTCIDCHGKNDPNFGAGIHSVLSIQRGFTPDPRLPLLKDYDRAQQEEAVLIWKRAHFSWGLLQGLMD